MPSYTRILGIDPGFTGGFVLLDGDGGVLRQRMTPRLDAKVYDILGIQDALLAAIEPRRDDHIVICETGIGWNNPSTAKPLAKFEGIVEALCVAHGLPLRLVTPQRWQKSMLAGTPLDMKPKARVKQIMQREFPEAVHALRVELWDAFLIARWGLNC